MTTPPRPARKTLVGKFVGVNSRNGAVVRRTPPRPVWLAVISFDNDPSTIEWQHTLAPDDSMDCDEYAKQFAAEMGVELAEADGEVPTGNADFTVRITQDPDGVTNFTSKSYFFRGASE